MGSKTRNMIIKRKDYKEVPYTKDNIDLYKSPDNLLKHARIGKKVDGIMLVDKKTNELIGYVAWEGNYIVALEVISKYRGNGFGDILIKKAIGLGAEKLSVDKNNIAARKLYEKHGFKENSTDLGPKMIEYERSNFNV